MFFGTRSLKNSGYGFGNLEGGGYGNRAESIPLPDKVIIPLKQGFSVETQCLVKKGDRVRAGQIIGRDDHTYSSPVHSSINGVVEYFESFTEGHEPHYGVVIRRDHKDERGYVPLPKAGSADKTAGEISEILYLAGVTSLGSTGIPSLRHSSDLELKDVRALVVNGLSAEPFSLPQGRLLDEKKREFITGIRILKRLLSTEDSVHIALHRDSACIPDLESLVGGKVHIFDRRYPLECGEIVTEITTGRRVPDGGTPSEVGAVVVTIQDVLHVYEAVILGKPLIERTIAVGGPGVKESRLLKVPVGTPIEWLLLGNTRDNVEKRILIGGAMRGRPVESASHPVERTCSALTLLAEDRDREFLYFLRPGTSILSFSRVFLSSIFYKLSRKAVTNIQGERRPCIWCSYCEDICPRRLVPHVYSRFINANLPEDAMRYGLEACIECGLCSFACPSKIPLMEDIKKGKRLLEEKGRWSHPAGIKRLAAEGKISQEGKVGKVL